MAAKNRRDFLKALGISGAALPFLGNLPVFGAPAKPRQRLVIFFSPNGVVPGTFWPEAQGPDFSFKESLSPFEPFKKQSLVLHGVCDKVRGDGDNHMRGIGCLLTGVELFPGNIQGGSHTPAGWSSGISIDQEIKNFLQKDPATKTRFGSLELGVLVPERADTWTRMSYTAPNKPVTPIGNPYQVFAKLYGKSKEREVLKSVLDDLQGDMRKISAKLPTEDKKILLEHADSVRALEKELQAEVKKQTHAEPKLEAGIREENENIPKITRMQLDLLVNSLVADFNRVATFQFTNSVGMARMNWLGISEGHHTLSHEPDSNGEAQGKLTKINKWYCEQIAYFAKRLSETPEPGGQGTLLDNTLIVWANELGKGNSHTLENIPFVLLGGLPGIKMGKSLKLPKVPHNRLLMSLAHGFGCRLEKFGNPEYCKEGPLSLT
ncbi:MAG: DUF1552 domain-containing protein [Gemmataceae bacterium]|nr:DUF1552 domain-containing protein [Gemmataceae bacterium]